MWKNEKKPSFLQHSTHKSVTKEQQQCQIRMVFHNKIVMLSLRKNAAKGKLCSKPRASAHGASKAWFKRKPFARGSRNLPEEMCSIEGRPCSWQPSGSVTLFILVCPQTALEAAELQTCVTLFLSNSPVSCSDTIQGFLYCTYTCAQCDLRVTGSYASKASLLHHIFLHFSIILYGLCYWCITALLGCYPLAQSGKAKPDWSSADLIRLLIMCQELQWLWGSGVFRNAV